jgi:hypothetical protein
MKGLPAQYMGKVVSKNNFRAYVYSPDGSQKLVESWDEYEECIASGVWFSTKEQAQERIKSEEPKKQEQKTNLKSKVTAIQDKRA